MATLPLERPGRGVAPRSRRAGTEWRLVWLFQLAFWSVFAAAFFLVVRPHHPFGDILLRQTAASATRLLLRMSACADTLPKVRKTPDQVKQALIDAGFEKSLRFKGKWPF